MKGLQKKGEQIVFRVSTRVYPPEAVRTVFGKGDKKGSYLLFSKKTDEEKIYQKFNDLLEVVVDGGP